MSRLLQKIEQVLSSMFHMYICYCVSVVQARRPVGASPQLSLALQRAAQGLPQHWQAGMTPDGRMYYINHVDKTTTWEKPRLQERHIAPVPAARAAQPATPMEQVGKHTGERTNSERVMSVRRNKQ